MYHLCRSESQCLEANKINSLTLCILKESKTLVVTKKSIGKYIIYNMKSNDTRCSYKSSNFWYQINISCFILSISTSRDFSDYAHGQDGIKLLSKNFHMWSSSSIKEMWRKLVPNQTARELSPQHSSYLLDIRYTLRVIWYCWKNWIHINSLE